MNHADIEEQALIDLYHRGALSPEQETELEEHFVDCVRCQEDLEAARGFQRGLKRMIAEDAARVAVQAGVFAWLARRGRLAQLGLLLAALLVAAGLPALWLAGERRTLNEERSANAELRQREGEARGQAADLQRRLAASERERERLASARPSPAPAPAPSVSSTPPALSALSDIAVVLLTAVRGGPGEPAATIDLSKASGPIALAVDPGADAHFASYRVAVTGPRSWKKAGLHPNALEVVMIAVPAGFLQPGDYRLTLTGVRADGTSADLGGYPFRVVR
jgi:hypothetical protein